MKSNQKQAVLFFSRTAEEEASNKRFDTALSNKANVAIAQSLIDSSLVTLSEAGFPLITSYSSHQTGASFGDKLANAVDDVFSLGYDEVIVIGNDCPFISKDLILSSFDFIQKGKLVLGPAKDGGVYLLGFNKDQFDKSQFANLNWEESDLQQSFKGYIEQVESKVQWLDEQLDIDTADDFAVVLHLLSNFSKLKIRLAKIISDFQYSILHVIDRFLSSQVSLVGLRLRGPPRI